MYSEESFIIAMGRVHRDKNLNIPNHISYEPETEEFTHHKELMNSIFKYIKHLDKGEIEIGFAKMMLEKNWHKRFWNRNPTLVEWLSFFKINLISKHESDRNLESRVESYVSRISQIINDRNCLAHLFQRHYKENKEFKNIVNQFCNLKKDLTESSRMQDMARYLQDQYNKNSNDFFHRMTDIAVSYVKQNTYKSKYDIVIDSSIQKLIDNN